MADQPFASNTALRITRRLAAPRAKVFHAWTDPETLKRWFAPSDDYSTWQAEVDLRAGGTYRIQMKAPDGAIYAVKGTYKDVQPTERLVFSWSWEGSGWRGLKEFYETLVTVELRTVPAGTELTLTHEFFPTAEERDRHRSGWTGCLTRLIEALA
ncbi:MAG: SRPBCC domain-containing protein [Nitrospirota bacterium]